MSFLQAMNEEGIPINGAFAQYLRKIEQTANAALTSQNLVQTIRVANPDYTNATTTPTSVFGGTAPSLTKTAGTKIKVSASFSGDYPTPNVLPCSFRLYIGGVAVGEFLEAGVDGAGRVSGALVWETAAPGGSGALIYDLEAAAGLAGQSLHIAGGNAIIIVEEVRV